MKKSYWYVIILYFITLFGIKVILNILDESTYVRSLINFIVSPVELILIVAFLRKNLFSKSFNKEQSTIFKSILWSLF